MGTQQPQSWENDAGSPQGFAFTSLHEVKSGWDRLPGNVAHWGKENPVLQAGLSPHHGSWDGNCCAAKPVASEAGPHPGAHRCKQTSSRASAFAVQDSHPLPLYLQLLVILKQESFPSAGSIYGWCDGCDAGGRDGDAHLPGCQWGTAWPWQHGSSSLPSHSTAI